MSIKFLTKKQMDEKRSVKPLIEFFKTSDGKPFCFGKLGEYQNIKPCSNCEFKKSCCEKYVSIIWKGCLLQLYDKEYLLLDDKKIKKQLDKIIFS